MNGSPGASATDRPPTTTHDEEPHQPCYHPPTPCTRHPQEYRHYTQTLSDPGAVPWAELRGPKLPNAIRHPPPEGRAEIGIGLSNRIPIPRQERQNTRICLVPLQSPSWRLRTHNTAPRPKGRYLGIEGFVSKGHPHSITRALHITLSNSISVRRPFRNPLVKCRRPIPHVEISISRPSLCLALYFFRFQDAGVRIALLPASRPGAPAAQSKENHFHLIPARALAHQLPPSSHKAKCPRAVFIAVFLHRREPGGLPRCPPQNLGPPSLRRPRPA